MARRVITLDFETASHCDLREAGAWRYAEDPTTEILCLCWEDGDAADYWIPGYDHPSALLDLACDPEVVCIAHNAGFEKAIWRNIMVPVFGFPDIPNERWHDTMAVCAMKGIPQQLEKALQTLGVPGSKDMAGSKYTIGLSRCNPKTGMRPIPNMSIVLPYCDRDVLTEKMLHRRIGWQPIDERETWLLDQRINERGVRLDREFIRASQRVVDRSMTPLLKRFKEITGVERPSMGAKFLTWLTKNDAPLLNLQKETIVNWLGSDIDGSEPDWWDDEDWTALPLRQDVAEALEIRQITASSSLKKLDRMEACVCADGRVRGVVAYHGAGTGRWVGRLFQPQNFPKPTIKDLPDPDVVVAAIMSGDPAHVAATIGPAVQAVVSGLRHAVVAAPDHVLIAGDFASIEARVVLAIAGQHDKTALLASGAEIYGDFASIMLGRPITKADPERNKYGKPGVLGCGFQLGWRKMMLKYGVPEELAKSIVETYRKKWAPEVPKLWYAFEPAAARCVHTGIPQEAYGVRFALEDGWLTARLPSGRKLWYWAPKATRKAVPWDEADVRQAYQYSAYKQGHMVTVSAYGGLITENIVQALARDLLVYAMKLMDRNGIPIILTVHDEIVAEVLAKSADETAFRQMMEERPPWAVGMGIPVAAETWMHERYHK